MGYTLITGATSGIGYELMKLFAKDGNDLVLVARSRDKLESIKGFYSRKCGIDIVPIVKDLSRRGAAREVFDEVSGMGIEIENLVNNAGIGCYGLFHELDLSETTDLLNLNILALTELTRLMLPKMVSGNRGMVLNIASTAAFQPGPLMAAYYASKAYVLSLSEALSHELEGTGVTVTALCPGPTTTDFQRKAKVSRTNVANRFRMSAAAVAEEGYRGMMNGKSIVVAGPFNKAIPVISKLVPRFVVTRAVKKLNT